MLARLMVLLIGFSRIHLGARYLSTTSIAMRYEGCFHIRLPMEPMTLTASTPVAVAQTIKLPLHNPAALARCRFQPFSIKDLYATAGVGDDPSPLEGVGGFGHTGAPRPKHLSHELMHTQAFQPPTSLGRRRVASHT